ncbi:MAG: hypothetical protein JSS66_15930 [Armatimonadetes bacterium]|nr:hypothetical protein [Armatimonadota bacterium]
MARVAMSVAFLANLVPIAASQQAVPVNAVTVVYGRTISGSVADLVDADGACFRFSRFTVANLQVDPVTLRFEARLPAAPSSLSFHITGRCVAIGNYTQSLNLFDWTKNVFDPFTNATAPLLQSGTTMVCGTFGPPSNYMRTTDNKAMALVRVRVAGPTPLLFWEVEYDQAYFEVQSGP